MTEEPRYWYIDSNNGEDDPALPQCANFKTDLFPIVDEKYGGVIGWANTEEQAQRIVNALRGEEARTPNA